MLNARGLMAPQVGLDAWFALGLQAFRVGWFVDRGMSVANAAHLVQRARAVA